MAKKGGAAKQQDKDKDKDKDEATTAAETKPEPPTADEPAVEDAPADPPMSPTATLSQQSKIRSSSFRQGTVSPTGFPLSPEGETAPEIYRKQVARIDDLEKENKRLAKEATDAEKRWQKAEEELADLREADRDGSDSQVEKLVWQTLKERPRLLYKLTRGSYRNQRSLLSSARTHNSSPPPPNATAPPRLSPWPLLPGNCKPNSPQNLPQLKPWN